MSSRMATVLGRRNGWLGYREMAGLDRIVGFCSRGYLMGYVNRTDGRRYLECRTVIRPRHEKRIVCLCELRRICPSAYRLLYLEWIDLF